MFYQNILYGLFAIVLAVVSIFTGEPVTFIMLGFILMSLITITSYLKKIYEAVKK
ncbi:hypothetical protein J2T17_003289 [Paenibacillus mucilaginosus]|uniref:hypothetical protein n=1 Tax=Paenibacillus mucilaginosus TaxID=61624 RepID=UPI003D20A226